MFDLEAYPASWRESETVMLRKPGKADYMAPNAYRPITLLNTMVKVLSACVTEDLTHAIETHNLLPRNHFGSIPGWTMMDSLHYTMKFIKYAWRRKKVVSTLFLD